MINGSGGDNSLVGGTGNDRAYGGAGADILLLGDYTVRASTDGADYGDGGAGNDLLWGFGGNDTLYGGDQNDTLVGNDFGFTPTGSDSLYGGNGDDQLFVGSSGSALMEGWTGNDKFYGGVLSDTLCGGRGSDYLFGNEGADVFLFYQGDLAANDVDIVYFMTAGDLLKFDDLYRNSLTLTNATLQYDSDPSHTVASVYISINIGDGQSAAIAVYGMIVAQLTPLIEYTL